MRCNQVVILYSPFCQLTGQLGILIAMSLGDLIDTNLPAQLPGRRSFSLAAATNDIFVVVGGTSVAHENR